MMGFEVPMILCLKRHVLPPIPSCDKFSSSEMSGIPLPESEAIAAALEDEVSVPDRRTGF